ncbi:hypothetical protein EI976_12610 [Bacillus licheniformis]|uniref:hypothetical protein n=1 Tax=Bacillus licheniformis TaxID=1402 RepID=UPI000D117CD1|nr:hypothetical protein [Bacillus licheniformis]KAA0808423.1 hypothetical protein EI978_15330 [Bacillus licheniformis]KAA0821890.1 hypothetical protein EI976_12610 [Bacillus licheniformis]KAA0823944.1 hypothetical protein EI973_11950 [Bacillus licheniformis]PSS52602.1 hypothetical protein C6399_17800 [Bacillus licheniformis]
MQRIKSISELEAVVEGGIRFINNCFDNRKIPCHPITEVTFLPSFLDILPTNIRKGIPLGWVLLYSNDGETWTYNFKDVLEKAQRNEGYFFITDWKLNVLMVVEYYMIEEVVNLLTTYYDDITIVSGLNWKPTRLGDIALFNLEEYFSE